MKNKHLNQFSAILVCCLLFNCLAIQAQPTAFKLSHSCSFDDTETDQNVYFYEPSDEASRIVNEIVDALGLSKNFSVKAAGVRNAVATEEGGLRYILYSTTFLEKFKGSAETRWAAYSVLAHEIGHHLNNDNFAETEMRRRKIYELEADRFSGSVLRMLGATLTEAQAGIESIELEGESKTHPAKAARREAVATGWKKRDEFLRANGQVPVKAPDQDQDGVPDSQDKCPTQAGLASNGGCPEAVPTVQKRTFEPSSFDLSAIPEPFRSRKSGLDLVSVQGGSFTIGNSSAAQGGSCERQVDIASFHIGKYEVTQGDWLEIMGTKPAGFSENNCRDCPVEQVSWNEVQQFIQKLNSLFPSRNYRLPTEAEWEYAARGGKKSKKYTYAGSNQQGMVAYYYGNSGRRTHPVGERKANELGIYDMSGNVWEWCADRYYPYNENCQLDKNWNGKTAQVLRGGAWDENNASPVYSRNSKAPDYQYSTIGFRLAHD